MNNLKQFKLTNDEEIICEVIQWDDAENAAMVVRGAMRIISAEDYGRGVRFYAFRPWMGFNDNPEELQTLNSVHIIGEMNPSAGLIGHYLKTIDAVKKALDKKKRDLPLDRLAPRVEDMSEQDFQEFLDDYLKENEIDIFDPEDIMLDSDNPNNVIKFKPKGTMH
jgi:hypothetical protein